MDTLTSKQDLTTKTRKPYTITKQRERWTSDEHNRFLEAIKLYGRAWQRIEEHIGTKTAVQIRSHAQKFFSKLEKEAVTKGVPLGHERDIDIPPPRPKRKPNNPYPRKSSAGIASSSPLEVKEENLLKSASFLHSEQIQDAENNPHFEVFDLEKPYKRTRTKENFDDDSEISTLSHKTPSTSYSLVSRSSPPSAVSKDQCVFMDFISLVKEPGDENLTDEFLNKDPEGIKKLNRTDANYSDVDDETCRAPNMNCCLHNLDKEVTKEVKLKKPESLCLLPKEVIKSNQNYPRHIPVHVLESSSETCTECPPLSAPCTVSVIHQSEGTFRNAEVFTNPISSGVTEMRSNLSTQESLLNFHTLLKPLSNTEDSCNMSVNTTISNLIVSTLLQNPAAHAAANFAASFWPFTNVKSHVDSPLGIHEGFQSGHAGLTPSASAIAAATVMAASAWWAAHGLLPLCSPVHTGFTSIHAPSNPSATDASPVPVKKERMDQSSKASPGEGQQHDSGVSKNQEPRLPDNTFPPPCSADYCKNGSVRSNTTDVETPGEQKSVPIAGLKDSHKEKTKELVDRSSCGSNTPSGSEVEMDLLEKQTNGKDEPEEHNGNQRPSSELNNHRTRSMGSTNESWREVSVEGKLAFKALFARQVLPQSFSPPKCPGFNRDPTNSEEDGIHELDKKCEDELGLNLNSKTLSISLDSQETGKGEDLQNGFLLMGGGHGKLTFRRTGFKPYKRCSVEAEKRRAMNDESNQGEERDPKRVCLEGEASV